MKNTAKAKKPRTTRQAAEAITDELLMPSDGSQRGDRMHVISISGDVKRVRWPVAIDDLFERHLRRLRREWSGK